MDDLLELVLDLLLDGVFWLGEEKRISLKVRIPLLLFSVVVAVGVVAFFLSVGFLMVREEPLVGALMMLSGVVIAVQLVRRVRQHLEKK